MQIANGYVNCTQVNGTNTYQYVFNYSDHLGNKRVSYTFDPAAPAPGLVILEKNNYYPYGLRHRNYNMDERAWMSSFNQPVIGMRPPIREQFEAPGKHKYKYNGQEWQGDFGYNMYDMPLRDYDPAIGRWVVQDPVIHHSQSTYSSFNGNPVLFADPTGGKGQMLDENGARRYDDNGNYIWRGDRVAPGEVSMAGYGSGGASSSSVQQMINRINGLSNSQKAQLPSPSVMLQILMAEANATGATGFFKKKFIGNADIPIESDNGDWLLSDVTIMPLYLYEFVERPSAQGGGGGNIFAQTYAHFQFGGGDPLTVSTSSLDFSGVTQKNLVYNSKTNTYGLDLYKVNPMSQTALALGKISLVSKGNNQYSIQPDYYDFNIEWDKGFTKRNIATFGAGLLHYGVNPIAPLYPVVPLIFGGPYWINFSGTVTIKP